MWQTPVIEDPTPPEPRDEEEELTAEERKSAYRKLLEVQIADPTTWAPRVQWAKRQLELIEQPEPTALPF
jgi:hypothetical protein